MMTNYCVYMYTNILIPRVWGGCDEWTIPTFYKHYNDSDQNSGVM